MEILTQEQKAFYEENGYLVLEAHLSQAILDQARAEIARISEHAKTLDASDDRLDLEESHTRQDPRIRRIKRPDLQSAFFDELMRSDKILAPVRDLIGPNVRMQTTKLNMKKAGFGAPVQWHQDTAYYPYTNDDVLAVGVIFDDVGMENGPLEVFPGSHRWPMLDHHSGGFFTGDVDLAAEGLDRKDAVALTGPAGTITIHHGRLLHGSALNRSDRDRQVLFYEMMAADAFPIMGSMVPFCSQEEFDARMLCGESTKQPRLTAGSVRLPLPLPPKATSLYEIQSHSSNRGYETLAEVTASEES